ncbi:diguanylate cyclase [Endozoicomonas sp. SM1973]|uniref:diguanylate cyclase n=1 Tax=Spartinivicinus marinus TaxID=2994442 RepID=A0A853I8A7_9GAMM|nr:diguanylate cyclase [Spartinivicinus marinus]MCX4027157.1 diguanylate cyclase [Spartinivicinus marinus]NYZ66121.1 diguanylate cyclase [Spartinivicinus marinus]
MEQERAAVLSPTTESSLVKWINVGGGLLVSLISVYLFVSEISQPVAISLMLLGIGMVARLHNAWLAIGIACVAIVSALFSLFEGISIQQFYVENELLTLDGDDHEVIAIPGSVTVSLVCAALCLIKPDKLPLFSNSHLYKCGLAAIPLIFGASGLIAMALKLPDSYGFAQILSFSLLINIALITIGLCLLAAFTNWQATVQDKIPQWIAGYLAIVLVIISTLFALIMEKKDLRFLTHHAQHTAQQLGNGISSILNTQRKAVERMAARWSHQGDMDKTTWMADANQLLKDFPEFQAIEWMDSDYQIRWLVPYEGNEQALNFRVPADNPAVVHLRRAFSSKTSVITQVIQLKQGGEGFINYTPIFDLTGRFHGYIVAVFRVKALVESITQLPIYKGFYFEIRERNKVIYFSSTVLKPSGFFGKPAAEHTINPNQHSPWVVQAYPSAELVSRSRSLLPTVVLFSGFIFTMMICTSIVLLRRSYLDDRTAEQAISSLKEEVARSNETEKTLKESNTQLELFFDLINQSRDALMVVDPETRDLLYYNTSTYASLGYTEEEFVAALEEGTLIAEKMDRVIKKAMSSRRKLTSNIYQMEVIKKDGGALQVEITTRMVNHHHKKYLIIVAHDVTANKEMEQRLINLATRDSLTGLFNRKHFDNCLEEEWSRAIRQNEPIALMMTDLDRFKKYNDSQGHQQGDICLKDIASILKRSITRSTDLLARYGGGEFAAILPETDLRGAQEIARRIHHNIGDAYISHPLSDVSTYITLSIGLASCTPQPGSSSHELLRQAEAALMQAKKQGRNRTCSHQDEKPPLTLTR